MNYETAIAFVISIRPRMAVEDADAAARRLMNLNDPLATELRQLIAARWGINAPGGGAWLKEAKDAIENPRVAGDSSATRTKSCASSAR